MVAAVTDVPPSERPALTEAGWRAAEDVVTAHYRAHGHEPVVVAERHAPWPYMFRLFLDDSVRAYALVDGGRVVPDTGLRALGRYLDRLGVYSWARLDVGELLDIVHVFDAWPPLRDTDGYGDRTGYATEHALDAELPPPQLERAPRELRLTLYYALHDGGDPFGEGSLPGPALVRAGRWELTLRAGKTPTWTVTLEERPRR